MTPREQGVYRRAAIKATLLTHGKMSREALAAHLGIAVTSLARNHLSKMPEVRRKAGQRGGIWIEPTDGGQR